MSDNNNKKKLPLASMTGGKKKKPGTATLEANKKQRIQGHHNSTNEGGIDAAEILALMDTGLVSTREALQNGVTIQLLLQKGLSIEEIRESGGTTPGDVENGVSVEYPPDNKVPFKDNQESGVPINSITDAARNDLFEGIPPTHNGNYPPASLLSHGQSYIDVDLERIIEGTHSVPHFFQKKNSNHAYQGPNPSRSNSGPTRSNSVGRVRMAVIKDKILAGKNAEEIRGTNAEKRLLSLLQKYGRTPISPSFRRTTKGKHFLRMLEADGVPTGPPLPQKPKQGTFPAYSEGGMFYQVLPGIKTYTEKRSEDPNNDAQFDVKLTPLQELDLLHFVWNSFNADGHHIHKYTTWHARFESEKKKYEEAQLIKADKPIRPRGGSGHGMGYVPGSRASGQDDFTFDDYLRDLFYHVSPAWQHYFLFNQDYNVDQYELLCHCLHYLYDLHTLEYTHGDGDKASNNVDSLNRTYQTIKCIGILIKVSYGNPNAKSTGPAIFNWQRDSIPRRIAMDLARYLEELHSGWKKPQGFEFNHTNLVTTAIENTVKDWRKRSAKIVDMTTLTAKSTNGSLHYLHFRAVNYIFDIFHKKKKTTQIGGRGLPPHISVSIERNDDRMYRLTNEILQDELAIPDANL